MHNNHLLSVEKPVRYLGGELGTARKETADIRFVLAFPDVYEVGMSHLGLQILYAVLNGVAWISAERVYSPWPDMEKALRHAHEPLTCLESGVTAAEADIVGFTLQYELSYTNILTILELSGIPLLAGERGTEAPLVIGGGPCAYNPEPLADFFDAFLLGDGEEAVIEIANAVRQWKGSGTSKAALLERLAGIEGVYVPSLFDVQYDPSGRISALVPLKEGYTSVRRRFVADLDTTPYPTSPVIPFLKTVHDRISMEIARGCTRGCRFCQAGYVYRPVRERTPEQVLELVEQTLRNTGYDEISLLSLSTGDYGCIAPLLQSLMAKYAEERIAVSFPSLRVGTLTSELVDEIKKVRKTGFTLAPEAGSERMRQVINKGITEEDLLANAFAAFSAGWRVMKLYFMIGLPGETREDVLGIAELAQKVKREGRRTGQGGDVNVSVGTFVPKPHTPFQWEPQIGLDETREKQQFLRQELRARKLKLKWQDAPLSFMEGVFARGDRRLGAILLKAYENGCRFDGWSEHFNFAAWQEAFAAAGMDPLFYHRRRSLDEVLPWDHLDCGVSKGYLLRERENADQCAATLDCRNGTCTGCGVCDFDRIAMRINSRDHMPPAVAATAAAEDRADDGVSRIRLRFQKTGAMRFLSHLELLNLFIRAVGKARIPIRFSQGFHPHPKFSFATALSVGIESWAEYMDMEISAGYGAERVKEQLNGVLPPSMQIMEAHEIPLRAESLSAIIEAVRYRVTPAIPGADLQHHVENFLALGSHPYRREKRGKVLELDLRCELAELKVDGQSLEMVIRRGKPLEFAVAITGLPPEELANARVEKLAVIFRS